MGRRLQLHPSATLMLGLAILALAACDLPQSHGDQNAVIVGASEDLWMEVEDEVLESLEPTIQTITDERAFRVSWHDPAQTGRWGDLRKFRQVLLIGTEDDPWVATALENADRDVTISPPQLLHVGQVWSRGQEVHVMLLGEGDGVEAVAQMTGPLHERLDQQFRQHTLNRMFLSGRNDALADSLRQDVGFGMLFPNVYQYSVQDSVFRFRNDNPTPSERIREIGLSWVTPIPETLPSREDMIEWRTELAAGYYPQAQEVQTRVESFREISVNGHRGVEYQASWTSPPDAWPAGGPFISRALPCPAQDRLYFVDAWLYSPGTGKYEYMIQLQTILDSFECA